MSWCDDDKIKMKIKSNNKWEIPNMLLPSFLYLYQFNSIFGYKKKHTHTHNSHRTPSEQTTRIYNILYVLELMILYIFTITKQSESTRLGDQLNNETRIEHHLFSFHIVCIPIMKILIYNKRIVVFECKNLFFSQFICGGSEWKFVLFIHV